MNVPVLITVLVPMSFIARKPFLTVIPQASKVVSMLAGVIKAKLTTQPQPSSHIFDVYLIPLRSGADPVTRELERLANYYAAKVDPVDEAKLRNIMSSAALKKPNYTSRELRSALEETQTREDSDRPYRAGEFEAPLKDSDYALLSSDLGKALEILDKARRTLVDTGKSDLDDNQYLWGLIGLQYLRVAEVAGRSGNSEFGASGSGTVQRRSEIKQRAISASDDAMRRALPSKLPQASGAKTDSRIDVDPVLLERAQAFGRLAHWISLAHNGVPQNERYSNVYADRQSLWERLNELYVTVLEPSIALYTAATTSFTPPYFGRSKANLPEFQPALGST